MQIFKKVIAGRECRTYLPTDYDKPGGRYPVLYYSGTEMQEATFKKIMHLAEGEFRKGGYQEFIFVSVQLADFDRECSPWPAPAVFWGNKDFAGGAREYLALLEQEIKPFIDKEFFTLPDAGHTGFMGYSLAGLLALYSLYESPCFGRIASVSGSLWYDGWLEYMENRNPCNLDARVYLSLGTAEERSRNRRLAHVGGCTRRTAEILKRQLSEEAVSLMWHPGGHFTGMEERLGAAASWFGKNV